jgi:hypothetical protein
VDLPEDIYRFVEHHFAAGDRPAATALLAGAKLHDASAPDARMLRCALVASGGQLAMLQQYVDMLKIDWRDVIMCGEYKAEGIFSVQIRDLSRPFPLVLEEEIR